MLKSGFKSSEFYAIAGYAAANYLHIDLNKVMTAATGIEGAITNGVAGIDDPFIKALVGGFVAFRFYLKYKEAQK